jgi:hypothetical protein
MKKIIFVIAFLAIANTGWCGVWPVCKTGYVSTIDSRKGVPVEKWEGSIYFRDYAPFSHEGVISYTNLWTQTIYVYKGRSVTQAQLDMLAEEIYQREQAKIKHQNDVNTTSKWAGTLAPFYFCFLGWLIWKNRERLGNYIDNYFVYYGSPQGRQEIAQREIANSLSEISKKLSDR